MNRRNFIKLLSLCTTAPFLVSPFELAKDKLNFSCSPEQSIKFKRLLSWNIGDIYLGRGAKSNEASKDKLEYITKILNQVYPEMIIFQEMHNEGFLNDIEKGTNRKYQQIFGPQMEKDSNRNLAMLIHHSIPYTLTYLPHLRAQYINLNSSLDLGVINYHGSYSNAEDRKIEVSSILEFLKQRNSQNIIAGDFNLGNLLQFDAQKLAIDESILRLIKESGFVELTDNIDTTTIINGIKLDYFFTNSDIKAECNTIRTNFPYMDHYPIVMNIN